MAATVLASKAYDLSGGALKEDLEDIIYDISPMDTIFMTKAGRGVAKSTTHEWLTDSLTAAAANAQVEGDEFSVAAARNLPSRLKNYTQISRKVFEVTGTADAVSNAGMKKLTAYHTARAAKELKRDIEYNVLNANPASAGTSVTARVSGSVPHWIYSGQHYKISTQTVMTTTAPASGFATASGTSWANSATAMVETDLRDMLKLAWSTGGEVDIVLCDATAFNKFSAYTGIATRFRDVASKEPAQIIGYSNVFVSAYGTVQLVLSRYMPSATAYGLQMNMWSINYLRTFETVDVARVSDADRKAILAEWTLVAKNPLANCKVHGVA